MSAATRSVQAAAGAVVDYDVIGAEVHRKAMEQIAREMGITLVRTSGSPVVTDAKDLSCTVLDENHEQVGFSGFVSFHVATSVLAIEAVLRNYDHDDIRPGDAFAANDPHAAGAIHQGDVGIVMPYFLNDELVGWGYVNEHLLDVGGASVSGFAPEAKDVFSEALRFAGVRIIRDYRLLHDWELFLAGNVRAPVPVVNDVRSMIASLRTGERRYIDTVQAYGLTAHRDFCRMNKTLTEEIIRKRIALLPDGEYSARDWVEYDGQGIAELHQLTLDLIIEREEMTLRFRGGPQVPSYINGAVPAILGQAMTTLQMMFLYDVPVNGGLWRPFHFDLGPEGTIVNSIPPAPVSQSHMEVGMRINKLVANTLSQAMMLSSDPMIRSRISGQPNNGAACFTAAGIQRATGQPTVVFPVSPAGPLGGPAQSTGDGQDTYSTQCSPGFYMPSAETDESTGPLLVLWRRIEPSSGGAGETRGGSGGTSALAIRGSDRMAGAAFNSVAEVPPAGAGGGLPGAATHWYVVGHSQLDELIERGEVPTIENLGGEHREMPAKTGSLVLEENDVFVVVAGGGGGLGDPLLRPPSLVARDVQDGYVVPEVAARVNGVLLDEAGEVDHQATADARRRIRTERLGYEPRTDVRTEHLEVGVAVAMAGGEWRCRRCGESLGDGHANFRTSCVERSQIASDAFANELSMQLRGRSADPIITLVQYFCPGCGSCVSADISSVGAEPAPAPRLTAEGMRLAEQAHGALRDASHSPIPRI